MIIFIRIFCVLALATSAFAQSAPAPDSSTIPITARAKNGAATELSISDIEIKADGKSLTVNDMHRAARNPLNYCLLFDLSGSERAHLQQAQEDAAQLLSKVIHTGDRGLLVVFNDKFHFAAEGGRSAGTPKRAGSGAGLWGNSAI
jgi:hypothetical protein